MTRLFFSLRDVVVCLPVFDSKAASSVQPLNLHLHVNYSLCLLCSNSHRKNFLFSDEDDFYDRTKKKPSTQKGSENQNVETVDSLLDKRDNVLKEIEAKNEQLLTEKNKMETENVTEVASGDSLDALDAYMTGLSTTLGNLLLFCVFLLLYLCFSSLFGKTFDDLKEFSFYWCQCKIKPPRSSKSCLVFSQS